jgi:hypothetical protein
MSATKQLATALLAVLLAGCAGHPILRDALIATAIASVAASSHHTDSSDGRKSLPPNPCTNHPESCK